MLAFDRTNVWAARTRGVLVTAIAFGLWSASYARAADLIEKKDGSNLRGRVIRETPRGILFEIQLPGGGKAQFTVPLDKIRALTVAGTRRVLAAGPQANTSPAKSRSRISARPGRRSARRTSRTAAIQEISLEDLQSRKGSRAFVEISPTRKTLRIRAPGRFAVIPDFIFGGEDTVYAPRDCRWKRLHVPHDSVLLYFLEGQDQILVIAWPKGRQGVSLLTTGEEESRRFSAIEFAPDGKKLYFGFLEGKGIWRHEDLKGKPVRQPLALSWKPPFRARWMADIVREVEGDVFAGSFARSWIKSRKSTGQWAPTWSGRLAFWGDESKQLNLYLNASKKMKARGTYRYALFYPLDREKHTPPTAFTVTDMVREMLGDAHLEALLDRGRFRRRHSGRNRNVPASCDISSRLKSVTRRKKSDSIQQNAIAKAQSLVEYHDVCHERIQEYLTWAKELTAFCERVSKESPALKPLVERTKAQAETLVQDWARCQEGFARSAQKYGNRQAKSGRDPRGISYDWARGGKTSLGPEAWRKTTEKLVKILEEWPANVNALMRALRPEMVIPGSIQDGMMGRSWMRVKWIMQQTTLAGGGSAEALAFTMDVRKRCDRILRNKHGMEMEPQDKIRRYSKLAKVRR